MREQILSFHQGMTGILTSPSSQQVSGDMPGVVFVNADPVHNRINVALARDMAARGVVGFRFDLSGSGDCLLRNDARPVKEIWVDDIILAMDYLATELRLEQFVILGMCKGARVAAEVAMRDSRVLGVVPINFDSPASLVSKTAKIRYWRSPRWWVHWGLPQLPEKLRALLKGSKDSTEALSTLHAQLGDFFGSDEGEIVGVWRKLMQMHLNILVVFSEFDRHHDFYREKVTPTLPVGQSRAVSQVAVIRNADHNMTMLATQARLQAVFRDWMFQMFGPGCVETRQGVVGSAA
ncbi:MAG: hypothetical protein HRT77_13120 [Halioglobus sp.]|nr:hypothetical protein [Halioglobus sp.]